MESTLPTRKHSGLSLRTIAGVFKLRIGVVITFTALAGLAVSGGPGLSLAQTVILTLAVLISSASAGAFNQYYEHDTDPLMSRTKNRPFATGEVTHGPLWLVVIFGLMAGSVVAAWMALNAWSALFTFLGAFFYAIVYTVWLKRRTWLNIVFGGLAGSWAVLAGATAADPQVGAVPLALALVLFLWTPPHFWSLAIAYRDDYAAAGVPMLPVVVGDRHAAQGDFRQHPGAGGGILHPAGIRSGRHLLRRRGRRRLPVHPEGMAAGAEHQSPDRDELLPRLAGPVDAGTDCCDHRRPLLTRRRPS
jgi:protoheme IX farnesyltransferase